MARAGIRPSALRRRSRGPCRARPRRRASGRTRADGRRSHPGSPRPGRIRGGRAPGGTRPSRRTADAGGMCVPCDSRGLPASRGRQRVPPRRATRRRVRSASPGRTSGRAAESGARTGSGDRHDCAPSRTGKSLRHRRSAHPRPSVAASSAFGRLRGRNGVVRGIPRRSASTGSPSGADSFSTLRTRASACATREFRPRRQTRLPRAGARRARGLAARSGRSGMRAPAASARRARPPRAGRGSRGARPRDAVGRARATPRSGASAPRPRARARVPGPSRRRGGPRAATPPWLRGSSRRRTRPAAQPDRRAGPSRPPATS